MKVIFMKLFCYCFVSFLLFAACQAKTEQADDTNVITETSLVNDMNSGSSLSARKSLSEVAASKKVEQTDSLDIDANSSVSYVWANTYLATTDVVSQEGDHFELHIAITLKEDEGDDYTGTINMFLSGCEDEMFRGTVKAKAEHNYVTVYFDEDVDGMDEMFNQGEKLVKFEIAYGEYVASWFNAMTPYVDEYTVLSLGK